MDGKFPVYLDGQEAQMIINALLAMAERKQTPQDAGMHRLLAKRVADGKVAFHTSTYQIMAAKYELSTTEEGNNAIHP